MPSNKRKSLGMQHESSAPARQQISYADLDTTPDQAPASESLSAIKRRKISYASDSDANDNAGTTSSLVKSQTSTTAASVSGLDNKDDSVPAGPYSYTVEKRREIAAKGSRKSYDLSRAQPRVDPVYGQMGALPGLEEYEDETGYTGPTDDALGYLRMVRSERRALPGVVTAPAAGVNPSATFDDPSGASHEVDHANDDTHDGQHDDGADSAGYYSDGAYIGLPSTAQLASQLQATNPQSLYHDALCARFAAHSLHLHREPTATAVKALDTDHPISLPRGNRRAAREWNYLLLETNPLPAQLASMDNGTVMRLLRTVMGLVHDSVKHGESLPERLGVWVWGLLGRLSPVGQMHAGDVVVVRDLAKTAIWAGFAYRRMVSDQMDEGGFERWADETEEGQEDETEESPEQVEDDADDGEQVDCDVEDGSGQGDSTSLESAKARLMAGLHHRLAHEEQDATKPLSGAQATRSPGRQSDASGDAMSSEHGQEKETEMESVPDLDTLATLDTIITVVGEFYGQRDLLESRLRWEDDA